MFFLIFAQNIECGYTLEPPPEAVLRSTHNLCFGAKIRKKCIPLYRAVIDIGDIDILIILSCDIDIDTEIVDIDILELGLTPVLDLSSLTINILKSINYSETM